jgi:hypothetical protein
MLDKITCIWPLIVTSLLKTNDNHSDTPNTQKKSCVTAYFPGLELCSFKLVILPQNSLLKVWNRIGGTCRFTRTHYPDSEPTRLCSFYLMLRMRAKQRSNKYQFYNFWYDPIGVRAHNLSHSRRTRKPLHHHLFKYSSDCHWF